MTVVRRYNGSTIHAEWCADEDHEGFCLDVLTGWAPAPEQVVDSTTPNQGRDASDTAVTSGYGRVTDG